MLNVHHLELFYYVARHKGITEAARHIPYGIQQPAISGQISQLEGVLGTKLFVRRPFALTPTGKRLYELVLPFFSKLPYVVDQLHESATAHLRLAASAVVLTTQLPTIFQALKSEFPGLRLNLKDASADRCLRLLRRGEVDLALTVLPRPVPTGCTVVELISLPMVLLVPEKSSWKSFKQIEVLDPNNFPPLISLPSNEDIPASFHAALTNRDLSWETHLEVDSLDLVEHFVASGFGIGLGLAIPARPLRSGLRQIALPGFPSVVIGLVAMGALNTVARRIALLLQVRAKELRTAPSKKA